VQTANIADVKYLSVVVQEARDEFCHVRDADRAIAVNVSIVRCFTLQQHVDEVSDITDAHPAIAVHVKVIVLDIRLDILKSSPFRVVPVCVKSILGYIISCPLSTGKWVIGGNGMTGHGCYSSGGVPTRPGRHWR